MNLLPYLTRSLGNGLRPSGPTKNTRRNTATVCTRRRQPTRRTSSARSPAMAPPPPGQQRLPCDGEEDAPPSPPPPVRASSVRRSLPAGRTGPAASLVRVLFSPPSLTICSLLLRFDSASRRWDPVIFFHLIPLARFSLCGNSWIIQRIVLQIPTISSLYQCCLLLQFFF